VTAQETKGREIVVVGTVHSATNNFTEHTLITILKQVKPDLILLELDPSFFDSSFVLAEKYRTISMENKAVLPYAQMTGVKLRPYDIEGRNKFYQDNDYFGREVRLNQQIARMSEAGQLPSEAKQQFEALKALSAVRDSCGAESPAVMNSPHCDLAVERKQHYAFKGIAKIVELTPSLHEFKPFWSIADDFWARRNEAMVTNIIRFSKELKAMKVLVLVGFEHRYYLRKRLAEQAPKEGFVVKEYWEY